MNDLLQRHYQTHHDQGQRLRQSFLETQRVDIFSEWLGTGNRLLDLGCRDGTLTRHFAEHNQVTGGDIDQAALAFASKKYGIKTRLVDLNASLPFADDAFDAVIMAEVLEHLPYPTITLGEISRVLRPGGKFIGNVPLAYHLKDRYQVLRGRKLVVANDPTHLQYFAYDDFLTLLANHFNVSDIQVLKGQPWSRLSMRLFARNIAFFGLNKKGTDGA